NAGAAITLAQAAVGRALAGNTAGAFRAAEEALAVARTIEARGASVAVMSLAAYAIAESDPERALALVNEAIELNALLERPNGPIWAVASHIAARLGNRYDALRFMARAIEQSHRIGARAVLHPMLRRVGDLLAPDDPEAAAILHGVGEAGT